MSRVTQQVPCEIQDAEKVRFRPSLCPYKRAQGSGRGKACHITQPGVETYLKATAQRGTGAKTGAAGKAGSARRALEGTKCKANLCFLMTGHHTFLQ